jgi:hypothetical protein
MKTDIQNWSVELQNDFITIKKDGEIVKGFLVKAADAVDKYHSFINKVQAMLAKTA